MAVTGVNIKLSDTQLGTPTPNDSIMMLFAPAVAVSGKFDLYTAYMLTQREDLKTLGLTLNNAHEMYINVGQFYDVAGPGYKLWICGVDNDPDEYSTIIADGRFESIIKSTAVGSFDNRPRVLGFVGKYTWATTASANQILNMWSIDQLIPLNGALESMFNQGYNMCAILDAITLDCSTNTGINGETQLEGSLTNLSQSQYGMIGIQVTTAEVGDTAAIGQTLGRLASIPISTSIGAVNLGPIAQTGYFLDAYTIAGGKRSYINTPVQQARQSVINTLGQYQYIFTRTRVSSATSGGIYYNDGATANSNDFALSSLEFARVANAVCDDVRGFFNTLINQGVPYDVSSGELDSGFVDTMISDLRAKYLERRILNGEAQDIVVTARATNGNYPATRSIDVNVKIYPVIALQQVFADVSFTVTA